MQFGITSALQTGSIARSRNKHHKRPAYEQQDSTEALARRARPLAWLGSIHSASSRADKAELAILFSGTPPLVNTTESRPPLKTSKAYPSLLLENKLQGELNLPCRGSREDLHKIGAVTVCRRGPSDLGRRAGRSTARRREIYPIEGIVAFGAKLQVSQISEIEIIEH